MGERIPTTKDIRNWATWVPDTTVGMKVSQQAEVEFDAWLAAHDREVEARALREAADDPEICDGNRPWVEQWLMDRADRIASP